MGSILYSVEMRLERVGAADSGTITGHHLLALLLRLIDTSDPRLAEELHRDSVVKPLTISPILPTRRKASVPGEGGILSCRITFLDERVFAALADAIWRLHSDAELNLGGMCVRCRGLATTPMESRWAKFTSFSSLLENASLDKKLGLEFLSPTTFRSSGRGERNVIFPEPALVFGSLINRWNAVAGADLKLDFSVKDASMAKVSGYHLTTRMVDFGNYQELGFIGRVTYECGDGLSEGQVRVLNALTDFAFYAGVGAKTTMGMGQCQRVKFAPKACSK